MAKALSGYNIARAAWKKLIKPALVKIASNPILNTIASAAACISAGPAGCVAFTALSSYAVSGDFGMALKAGVITAVTIQASAFIKANIGKTAGLIEQTVKRAVAHGVVGGTVNVVNGGKFGTGFMSSFVTKLASPGIQGLSEGIADGTLSKVVGAVGAAIVGGTASELGGGKFANGAQTALTQYLFNQAGDSDSYRKGVKTYVRGFLGAVRHVFKSIGIEGKNAQTSAKFERALVVETAKTITSNSQTGSHLREKAFQFALDNPKTVTGRAVVMGTVTALGFASSSIYGSAVATGLNASVVFGNSVDIAEQGITDSVELVRGAVIGD